ncbi:hypothetical protein [Arthrospiribacter ruber]|nr:hypothetical protein [Arthrospiribacter ruber]
MKYEEWIIQLKSELDPFDQLDMKTFAKAMRNTKPRLGEVWRWY